MSSLRLALKQSLKEASRDMRMGSGASSSSSRMNKKKDPNLPVATTATASGEPPRRKRGRPRKHPLPEEREEMRRKEQAQQHDDDEENEAEFSSENEFSVENEDEVSSGEHDDGRYRDPHRHHHSAANKIQNHWKRKYKKGSSQKRRHQQEENSSQSQQRVSSPKAHMRTDSPSERDEIADGSSNHSNKNEHPLVTVEGPSQTSSQAQTAAATTTSAGAEGKTDRGDGTKKGRKSKKSNKQLKTVRPPDPELFSWQAFQLPPRRARRHVVAGLRVKVRFATQSKKESGKRKKMWFGGRVSAVSKEGSKIRIKYDDGTTEVTKFPDKDIVVDDTSNGQHQAPADKFLPPPQTEDEEQKEVVESEQTVQKQTEAAQEPGQESVVETKKKHSAPPAQDEPNAKLSAAVDISQDAITTSTERVEGIEKDGDASKERVKVTTSDMRLRPEASNKPLQVAENEERPTIPQKESKKPSTTGGTEAKPEAPIKVKRKRGRPPKHRPPQTDTVMAGADKQKAVLPDTKSPAPAIVEGSTERSIDVQTGEKVSNKLAARDKESSNAVQQHGAAQAPESEETRARPSLTIRIPLKKDEQQSGMLKALSPKAPKPKKSPMEEGEIDEGVSGMEGVVDTSENVMVPKKKRTIEDRDVDSSEEPAPKRLHIYISSQKADKDQSGNATPKSSFEEEERKGPESVEAALLRKTVSPTSSPRQKKKKRKIMDAEAISDHFDDSRGSSLNVPKFDIAADSEGASLSSVLARSAESGAIVGSENSAFEKKLQIAVSMSQDEGGKPSTPRPRTKQQQEAPIVRSGRRAAQQANERISARQEVVIQDQSAKGKKKRRKEGEAEGHESPEDGSQWVQCDGCGKWRIIPANVVSSLPKQWYCKDNIYDPKRASCDAPEQTDKELAKERRRMKKRKRMLMEAAAADANQEGTVGLSETPREKIEHARSPRPKDLEGGAKPKRSSPSEQSQSAGSAVENQPKADKKLVPCSSAKKGRSTSDEKEGGAPIEPVPEVPVRRGRGRPRRNPIQNKEAVSAASSNQAQSDDADNVEWVQCEKCDKWRKLPPHISASELPEVWYCSMNTWSGSASCDEPEDKADGLQDVGLFGNSSNSNKLSYRNLIFGSTGRKANRPVSERARAAESLFGVVDEDEDAIPTVMYANSSAFVSRSRAVPGPEESEGMSIFDLMDRSRLWAELRAKPNQISAFTFNTLPSELKKPVKDLVLEVLGERTLSGEEVVNEVEKGNWENLKEPHLRALPYCTINVVVTALCELVGEGILECVNKKGAVWPVAGWYPHYRRAKSTMAPKTVQQPHHSSSQERKESRCMKIAKPWKRTRIQ